MFSMLLREDENAPLNVLMSILEEVSTNLGVLEKNKSAVKIGVEVVSGSKTRFSP
jgi:hypothetical protein